MRVAVDDFVVEELPSWSADGQGEHDVLWVEKRDANTRWVAGRLAEFAGVAPRAVSYAGLKDRRAIARQWFSVHRPGRQIDWGGFRHDDIDILSWQAHSRKLRVGTLAGNRFRLRLRDCDAAADAVAERIARIGARGLPNYFGGQRFGREHGNLELAARLADGHRLSRAQRGFALSAARAALFNDVLEQRVVSGHWDRVVTGDALMLDGRGSFFVAAADDDEAALAARVAHGELHPSGPLWGRGLAREVQPTLKQLEGFARAAERAGADPQRRALRVFAEELHAHWQGTALVLEFALPAGSFATALVNELVAVDDD